MADDLPIKVTLDPGPAAAGGKKVVQTVAEIENQTKKTNASVSDLKRQLVDLEREAEKAAKAATSINFKQAAAGANQFFQLLNQNLKLTDGAFGQITDSATKFGAAGAQLGGVWGAALGAIVGMTTELFQQTEEFQRLTQQYKLQILADEAFIRDMKEIKGLLDGTSGAARDVREAVAAMFSDQGLSDKFFEQWRQGTKDIVLAQQAAEAAKNVMVELRDISDRKARGEHVSPAEQQRLKDSGFTMAQYQHAIEEYSKTTLQLELRQKAYGDTVTPILNAEQDRSVKLGKLKKALEDTTLTQSQHNAVLREYQRLLGIDPNANSAQWERANDALAAELTQRRQQPIQDVTFLRGAQSMYDDPFADVRKLDLDKLTFNARGGEYAKNALTSSWFAELEQLQAQSGAFTASLEQDFGKLVGVMAQTAVAGTQSFEQMFASIAGMAAELLFTKGFQALASLFGGQDVGSFSNVPSLPSLIPGFATGGYIPPGGGGGTDSQLVMFRKSPEESVHINTPPQEAAMRAGGGSQAITVNVSEGNIVRTLEGADGRSTILRVVAEAFPQLRAQSGRG